MMPRVGYREPVPIWNRFQYNRYLPGPKCNADFGASFRCLSQLNTLARQIAWGICKTAPAANVNFVAHAHWCFHSNTLMTVKRRQAQTELAINLLTEKKTERKTVKSVAVFRTHKLKHSDVKQITQ